MKYVFLLFITTITLFSCSSSNDETSEPPENITLDEDSLSVKEIELKGIQGHFTIGDEAMVFVNCDNLDGLYWVEDETGVLEKKISEITGVNSYKTYVIEIEGLEKNRVSEELQESFSKTLTVSKVLSIEPRTHLNACLSTETWGHGDNDDWSLYISKEEDVLEFYVKEKDVSYQFSYSDPIETDKGYSYVDETFGNTINIVLEKHGCENGYGAIITLNDETFMGCASKNENLSF